MNAQTEVRTNVPALIVGGGVGAIVPQSIEEMWRVSKMVVMGGLAPKALVGKKTGEEAISAVAIAVMAGAELGLPPMVSLRSFTVIGGRPALYGDGIINVARRSRKAAYIRTGYDEKRGVGWCEAKRADTGEVKREEFSVADAKRAGLWDDRATVKKQDWNTKQWTEVPNDAPWHRYPQRMQQWRAAGYCLRELFADVLGGITDEYEAREIYGEDEPITLARPPAATRLTPPSIAAARHEPDPTVIVPETGEQVDAIMDGEPFDTEAFLAEIDGALATVSTEDLVIENWDALDVEATLTGDDAAMQRAFDIRKKHMARVGTFPGDKPSGYTAADYLSAG